MDSSKLLINMKKCIAKNFSHLSPVSLTPLLTFIRENLRKFLKKIRNGPYGVLRGPGDTDSWKKNLKLKISYQTPFK